MPNPYLSVLFTALLGAGAGDGAPAPESIVAESKQVAAIKEGVDKAGKTEPQKLDLYEELKRKKSALAEDEARMTQSRADLTVAEARVRAQIEELKKLREENQSLLKKIQEANQALLHKTQEADQACEKKALDARQKERAERIERLVKLIEKMPPGNAATYLEGFDEDVAASILGSMSVKKAALIVSAMAPSKANSLTRSYLSRDPIQQPLARPVSSGPR